MLNTVVISAGAAAVGAVAGAVGTVAGWGAANAGAILVSGAQSMQAQQKAADKQKKIQKAQAAEIRKQQGIALEKRKGQIDLQRKQIVGAGSAENQFSLNNTGSTGSPSDGSLTGVSLG